MVYIIDFRVLSSKFDIHYKKKYGFSKQSRHINMRVEPNIDHEDFLNVA